MPFEDNYCSDCETDHADGQCPGPAPRPIDVEWLVDPARCLDFARRVVQLTDEYERGEIGRDGVFSRLMTIVHDMGKDGGRCG